MAILNEPQEAVDKVEETYGTLEQDQLTSPEPTYLDYDEAAIGTRIDEEVDFKGPEEYVAPKSATVQGQLTSLLDRNSKYINSARLSAAEQSQERGMLNTSMASGAGERAAIESALPIAQQDAKQYGDMAQTQQQYEYELEKGQGQALLSNELVKQEASVQMKNQSIQNAFDVAKTSADTQAQAWMKDLEVTYSEHMLDLESVQAQVINNAQYDATALESMNNSTAAIMQNYQISVENLMTDPDFLQLGAEAVNKAINEMQTLAKNSIMFVGASQNVDMTDYVNMYLSDITVMDETVVEEEEVVVEEPVV